MRNCVWLKMLKTSHRNSRLSSPCAENFLNKDILKFVRAGLLTELRPELPKVRPRGAAKAAGLRISGPMFDALEATLGLTECGLPTRSAKEPMPRAFPTPAL